MGLVAGKRYHGVYNISTQPLHDKIIPKDCQVEKPLVIQGFSNFLGLFQVIMANPVYSTRDDACGHYYWEGRDNPNYP